MILAMILTAAALTVFAIGVVVYFHLKKTEQQKYMAAAGNILREDYLNYSLQNTINPQNLAEKPKSKKIMIYIKSKSDGSKLRYVFDPEKTVLFGRSSTECNVFINNAAVSQKHCRIYVSDNAVWLQDVGSSNGTVVKRGFTKRYTLSGGYQIALESGDRICIGDCCFKVRLFLFDLMTD